MKRRTVFPLLLLLVLCLSGCGAPDQRVTLEPDAVDEIRIALEDYGHARFGGLSVLLTRAGGDGALIDRLIEDFNAAGYAPDAGREKGPGYGSPCVYFLSQGEEVLLYSPAKSREWGSWAYLDETLCYPREEAQGPDPLWLEWLVPPQAHQYGLDLVEISDPATGRTRILNRDQGDGALLDQFSNAFNSPDFQPENDPSVPEPESGIEVRILNLNAPEDPPYFSFTVCSEREIWSDCWYLACDRPPMGGRRYYAASDTHVLDLELLESLLDG